MPSKRPVKRKIGMEGIVMMPKALYHSNLDAIQFGSRRLECDIQPIDQMGYEVSHDLWDALSLPEQPFYNIEINADTLRLLPLIGLFTTAYVPGTQAPFGKDTSFYKKWLQMTAEKGGAAYFFSRDKLNWEEGTIKGLWYDAGIWKESIFPFPDVVYDRLPNRKAEHLHWVAPLKETFVHDYGIPWFNPGFFNKWDIYNLLNEFESIQPFLPETALYTEQDLKRFLNTYPTVYLKPKDKSRGVGIFCIQRQKEGGFRIKRSDQPLDEQVSREWAALIRSLSTYISSTESGHYLIQEGVPLLQKKNRFFDFRVHTNKDKKGSWQVTAVAAKLAGHNQVTTHLAYGGDVCTLSDIFDKKTALEVFHQLEDLTLRISCALEEKVPGLIGELGFDLGLDDRGHLFLFEVNSKPRHHIFLTPSIRNQLKYVHSHWFDFCTSIAHLSLADPTSVIK
ncbi:MAG TPA: YheC/YheD family protein [Sporolactobacillaceae bacterium]|nr:YheC/YheD family protein [Sporolactobacillaceae bacterium]